MLRKREKGHLKLRVDSCIVIYKVTKQCDEDAVRRQGIYSPLEGKWRVNTLFGVISQGGS